MPIYKNKHTGQVIKRVKDDARLNKSSRWDQLADNTPVPEPKTTSGRSKATSGAKGRAAKK